MRELLDYANANRTWGGEVAEAVYLVLYTAQVIVLLFR
jgi:hypothetical protein